MWPELHELFVDEDAPKASQQDLMDRLMFIQCLETVRCIEEGVFTSVADGNVGSIFGWGFAPFKGGTLQFINDYGVAAFVERAQQLAEAHGERFVPPQMLIDMAAEGRTFV